MKVIKLFVSFLLLPALSSLTVSLYDVWVSHADPLLSRHLDAYTLPLSFLVGLLLLLVLPRPMRLYVLGHELTHALWGLVMGAKIGRIQVGRTGGSVTLSKSNFLITLAPYFFPLYTFLIIVLYYLCGLFFDLTPFHQLYLICIGLSYAFHLFLTIEVLTHRQSDVTEHGYIFSYTIILMFNVVSLLIWEIGTGPMTFRLFIPQVQTLALAHYAYAYDLLYQLYGFIVESV